MLLLIGSVGKRFARNGARRGIGGVVGDAWENRAGSADAFPRSTSILIGTSGTDSFGGGAPGIGESFGSREESKRYRAFALPMD